ncbi:MAG: hypothetical protein KGQ46_14960 [Hyphomicrobiales bacterium]|nr:hypothetical protein [Hyphomicrobiales bacterium]MDE2115450.1 hypothetical protein [Hyphomicrobiales bacterium]
MRHTHFIGQVCRCASVPVAAPYNPFEHKRADALMPGSRQSHLYGAFLRTRGRARLFAVGGIVRLVQSLSATRKPSGPNGGQAANAGQKRSKRGILEKLMSQFPTPNPPGGPSASGLSQALRDAGVTHMVTVPDFVQFALHEKIGAPGSPLRQVFACSEDQALTTATGLYIGGAKPAVMMQNQGFYKCMNTLRATCIDSGVPLVFFVGQFGREQENFGHPARESGRSVVRIMEPLLEAIGIKYWNVDDEADVAKVGEAFAHAHAAETAAIVLIGRHVTWN